MKRQPALESEAALCKETEMEWDYVSKTEGFDSPAAILYSCDRDAEQLTHSSVEDAIEEALDRWLSPNCNTLEVLRRDVGETITVYAFKRRELDAQEPDSEWMLELIYERLDEKYGDPDGYRPTEPSHAVKDAASALCALIRKEYESWSCEECGQAIVNVEAYVRANRQDWLS